MIQTLELTLKFRVACDLVCEASSGTRKTGECVVHGLESALGAKLSPSTNSLVLKNPGSRTGFPREREVLEGEVADAGVGLAPEDLGFTQNAGRGDGDVLEKDARQVSGVALFRIFE